MRSIWNRCNPSVAVRLFALIGLLCLIAAVAGGGASIYTSQVYSRTVALMQRASERAVMDSLGVYMAKDPAEVERFGKPLLVNLARIQERMSRWSTLVDADSRALFEECARGVDGFVRLRTGEQVRAISFKVLSSGDDGCRLRCDGEPETVAMIGALRPPEARAA